MPLPNQDDKNMKVEVQVTLTYEGDSEWVKDSIKDSLFNTPGIHQMGPGRTITVGRLIRSADMTYYQDIPF